MVGERKRKKERKTEKNKQKEKKERKKERKKASFPLKVVKTGNISAYIEI